MISMIILESRKDECSWSECRKDTIIVKVVAFCVYLACPLPLETWAITVKMVVRLTKQGKEANKNFLVSQLQSRKANRLRPLPSMKWRRKGGPYWSQGQYFFVIEKYLPYSLTTLWRSLNCLAKSLPISLTSINQLRHWQRTNHTSAAVDDEIFTKIRNFWSEVVGANTERCPANCHLSNGLRRARKDVTPS